MWNLIVQYDIIYAVVYDFPTPTPILRPYISGMENVKDFLQPKILKTLKCFFLAYNQGFGIKGFKRNPEASTSKI